MSAVTVRMAAAALLVAGLAAPAAAVGLGPLRLTGTIDGPREGFQLDLLNSDADVGDFTLYAVGLDDEQPQARVAIFPAEARLGGNRSRKVLVIAQDLGVDETFRFRVCAERRMPQEGNIIHARVCSKISAHRID